MKNNLFFCYNHGVVSVAATAKQYFFCQNHGAVHVVPIGRKIVISFSWSQHGECNIEMKKYIFLL